MNFLKIGKVVLEIVPLVIKFIDAINKAIPEAQQGLVKLEILKGIILEILNEAEELAEDVKNSVLRIIEKFVELYVKAKKKIHGVF